MNVNKAYGKYSLTKNEIDIVELENQTIVLPFSGEFAPITVDPSAS